MSSTPHRHVTASLAETTPDATDIGLTPLIGQIVRSVDAEGGCLVEVPAAGASLRTVCEWTRPGVAEQPPLDLNSCPVLLSRLLSHETIVLRRIPDDLPAEAGEDARELMARGIRSLLIVPAPAAERLLAVVVKTTSRECSWSVDVQTIGRFTAELFAAALDNVQTHEELNRAKSDLARLTQRLESQTQAFKDEIRTVHDFDDIVGSSPAFLDALAAVREVAPTDTTVLLLGETGTGKELFARALHERSARRHRAFVCVNCASLPASLIESELFGHERGAFTGAVTAREGRFELADRGTIFLDEIGDLPLELQPKLLRVLQEREFERVGSATRRKIDVRVIAATHHDLHKAVVEGKFRADLSYRLSVFPITLPPLRERRADIPHLVWFLINQRQRRLHRRIADIPQDQMDALQRYHWPGNVRELENVIERAMIRAVGSTLHVDESLLSVGFPATFAQSGTLADLERAHIEATLRQCRGRINGAGNAAERLGVHPSTLRFRMKRLGVARVRPCHTQ